MHVAERQWYRISNAIASRARSSVSFNYNFHSSEQEKEIRIVPVVVPARMAWLPDDLARRPFLREHRCLFSQT